MVEAMLRFYSPTFHSLIIVFLIYVCHVDDYSATLSSSLVTVSLCTFDFYARKQLLLSARLSRRNSVRPSICPSVCHMGRLVKNGAS